MTRYFKPRSVTWWAGAAMIVTGLIRGLGAAIDLGPFGQVIDAWSGGASPSSMILGGAAFIGLRGAVREHPNV